MADLTLRDLPSVDALLRMPDARGLIDAHGRPAATAAFRTVLDRCRSEHRPEPAEELVAAAGELLDRPPGLRRVLNATGVVLHTNLGRAPLADRALERVADAAGYSTLELDLDEGRRGSRQTHVAPLLRELTGAEDAIAVNNNAAAVLLALAALAAGGEVLIGRGELIEIGDGFRIPDILAQSGAELVEVGTTNRTHLADYERALGERTKAILRVHQSNFRMVGFAGRPDGAELVELGRRHGVPVIDDLGSGSLVELPGPVGEPTARESVAAGATLVCFSADKLLGGPQAGILAGEAAAVERARRHPLARALRIDKLSLAALEATLELYRDPDRAMAEIPVLRSLAEPAERVRARAEELAARLGGEVVETVARVGGGAVPLLELPSFACALAGGDELARRLRQHRPPVVARISDGRVLLDCRTLSDTDARCIAL